MAVPDSRHSGRPGVPAWGRAMPLGAAFLALLVVVFLFEPLFLGAAPLSLDNRMFPPFVFHAGAGDLPRPMNLVTTDINGFVLPEMFNQTRRLQAGDLPLWNPYQILGQPLLADMGFVTFYPTSLLFLWLPPFLAYALAMAVHYWLLGMGTLLFLRRSGHRPLAAITGATVAMLCGFVVVRLHLPHFVRTAAWFPWLLLALARLREWPSARRTAVAGLLVALLLLAGVPQTALLLLGAAGLWFLAHVLRQRTPRGRALAGLLAATVLGGAFAAPQLLPATQLLRQSWRSEGMSAEVRERKRLEGKAAVAGLLLPHFFGDPVQEVSLQQPARRLEEFPTRRWLQPDVQQNFVENAVYVGIVPLVLALLGLASWRGAGRGTALLLVLFGLGLSAGWPGFSSLGRMLPGFSSGSPKRALVLVSFGLAFLAAAGMDVLPGAVREGAHRRVRAVLTGAALLGLAVGAAWFLPFERWILPGDAAAGQQWFREALRPDLATAAGSGVALLLAALALHRGSARAAGLVLLCATSLDGLRFARVTNPPQPAEHQYEATPAIRWLQDHGAGEQQRFITFAADSTLPGGLCQVFSLRACQGIAALVDRETGELLRALEPGMLDPEDPRWVHGVSLLGSLESPLLDLLGVRYVMTSKEGHEQIQAHAAELPAIRQVYTGEREWVAIYERTTALPAAFLVAECREIPDPEERLAFLASAAFDPARTAVLEDGEVPAGELGKGAVTYRRPSPERIELDVTGDGPGLVVVSESHFPGWRARVDDAPVPVERVDHALLGVRVPGGRSHVVLEYESRPLRWGLGLAAAALVACAALLCLPGGGARRGTPAVGRHEAVAK